MTEHVWDEVTFEVWREHGSGKDVQVRRHMAGPIAALFLDECRADKAENYPDAPIDFYMVRATTRRERVS